MRFADWSQTLLFALVSLLPLRVALAQEDAAGDFDLAAALGSGPPMTAARAAEVAAAHAPSLERADALARVAELAVLRTRDQLLPRLELGARYAHVDGFPDGRIDLTRDPAADAVARMLAEQVADPAARALFMATLSQPTTRTIEMPRDQVALTARLTWPVSDLFLSVRPSIDAAEATARVAEAQRVARLARVRLSAREAFYQLARARGALLVAERARAQAESQRAQIDSAVRAGVRPPADGAAAAARFSSAEQSVAAAAAAVEVADASLRTLLEDEDGPVYGIAEPIFDEEATEIRIEPVAALLARARAQRAEVRALRESIVAQQKSGRVARAGGYPHLGVSAGADYARPNRYVIPPSSKMHPSWEVGASLTYAPNDTLTSVRRGRESDAQVAVLTAELAEVERALTLEIRSARASLSSSARTVQAARDARVAAEEAYARRRAELTAGTVTTADLFAAEFELNHARLSLLDASIEQQLARARLAYALGE